MLNKIIGFSLHNRITILTAALLLLVSGSYVATRMEVDVFPELTAPTVVIMTESSGMAPEEVEKLVTFPIETAVNGATGIRRVRSKSSMGFSIVWAEFDWNTDIFDARQTVTERLLQVSEQLPIGVNKPVIAPQASLLGEMMIIGMQSDTIDGTELRTIAEWDVRPRLLSIAGVAQVTTIGGDFLEYQVLADPLRMSFFSVTMNELAETCRSINENTSGGFINEYGNIYIVRGIARTDDTDQIASSVIRINDGLPVTIRDVATVVKGPAPRIGTASHMGSDAVLVNITKQPGINTVRLTEEIDRAIDELRESWGSEISFHTDIYRQSEFIATSVNNVLRAIMEGGIFVVIVLFIFLLNFRTTIISLVAIPLSILFSILALKFLGQTINTMSLGGMAIAIGSLVDDAIIDVENVYKNLRRNISLPDEERKPALDVIYSASKEIRSSIFNATLIIIITFVPLFFLEGFEGRMLKPLGVSFIVSLFASLVVALTITPALCSYMLTDEKRLKRSIKGSWVERKLKELYSKSLSLSLKRGGLVIWSSVILLASALLLMLSFGTTFLPPFNEGALTINISALPGISLEESSRIGSRAEEILEEIPEILTVSRKTGRAELAEHSFGENVSEFDVPFALKERSRSEFFADVRAKLNVFPGANVEVGQPITHRMDNMLSGTRANIAIKIFGDDLNELYSIANRIKESTATVEGIGDIAVEQLVEVPQLRISAKRELLSRYGIPINNLNEFIRIALGGEKVSDVFIGDMKFPMVLRYDDKTRGSIEGIKDALIDTWDGKKVPLSFVADVRSSSGSGSISRENVKRRIVVSVNVADRDIGSVLRDIESTIATQIALPEGYRIEYGGQFENAKNAIRRLVIASIMAIMVIFMILYQEFRDTKLAVIILINLPLALIGGVYAIWFSSGVISIPAIIGFITLFGIATRNGLLLVSRYESLGEEFGSLRERVIHGSADRLNPILMTALTAALALIPLAAGGDLPGNEIQSPMAVVILGGLLSSTLLNIYVIPAVYLRIKRKNNKDV